MTPQELEELRIIAVCNQKGGVGKTTTCASLAYALSQHLHRPTLMIDMDPQANLTAGYGGAPEGADRFDIVASLREREIIDTVKVRDNLWLVPGSLELAAVEMSFGGHPSWQYFLKKALAAYLNLWRGPQEPLKYVLIDCPPNLSFLTINALTVAREVFVPIQCEGFALGAVARLLDTVEMVREDLNKDLKITGVLGTRYDARRVLNKEIAEQIRLEFGAAAFKTLIPENVTVAEAWPLGKPLYEYSPLSKGADAYERLAEEVIAQEKAVAEPETKELPVLAAAPAQPVQPTPAASPAKVVHPVLRNSAAGKG